MGYPFSLYTKVVHVANVDKITAGDTNALEDEVVAIESALIGGFQHHVFPLSTIWALGTISNPWGAVWLAADPGSPMQAATKQYVDARVVPSYDAGHALSGASQVQRFADGWMVQWFYFQLAALSSQNVNFSPVFGEEPVVHVTAYYGTGGSAPVGKSAQPATAVTGSPVGDYYWGEPSGTGLTVTNNIPGVILFVRVCAIGHT